MADPRPPLQVMAARTALAVGSMAGLGWLAPLEYGTGAWLGMEYFAVCVPLLIDSYVVLSVLTARDRRYALPIAGVSGFVGQLHRAGVLPETDATARGMVAAIAALIAVAVTARLKPLVAEVFAAWRTELAETERTETARREAHEVAVRAHEEAVRAQEEAAREAAHRRAQETVEAAHRRRMEEATVGRTAVAHGTAPDTARADRTATARKRTATARKAAARVAHSDSDLQRRARVRAEFEASVRAGEAWDNRRLACALNGVDEPDPRQLRAASARASEWRRAVEAEGRTETVEEAAQ